MAKLVLESLQIVNFRAFKDLQIDSLGRVNLVVGKNNVGKTSLLEALQLYCARSHSAIWDLLSDRDEGAYPGGGDTGSSEQRINRVRFLFHGRELYSEGRTKASIGEIRSRVKEVVIEFGWQSFDSTEPVLGNRLMDDVQPVLLIRYGSRYLSADHFDRDRPAPSKIGKVRYTFVPARGLTWDEVDLLWGQVALTKNELEISNALRIISPHIEAIGIITNPNLGLKRTTIVKTTEASEPVSLQSMGDGSSRLFYISLALVNSAGGLLLIDEVGAGLHYSVQLGLWRLIFAIASKLNVQVFATTHSNDCIHAFQIASQESEEKGLLIRLEKRKSSIVPILFDEKRLAIATSEEIEVR